MIFYDFEVTKYDWLVVCIDPGQSKIIKVHNDREQLERVYESYKEDIWIGYNNRHYDQYIFKGILCEFSPYDISQKIITDGVPGWKYSNLFHEIPMINYDTSIFQRSLKELEGFQGHDIYETDVSFKIDRKLTQKEVELMFSYCENDVKETMNVFSQTLNEFNALLWLVNEFDLPLSYMSKTKAQIVAEILECERIERDDEWELYTLPCLELSKYKRISEWFMDEKNHHYKTSDGSKHELVTDVAGVEHHFSWGGIHGAKNKFHFKCVDDWLMIHVDVASYYPRFMIFHNLLTRNAKAPEKFKLIFDKRLELKAAKKKKKQAPFKIVINGAYGITKDKNNKAYDPRNANLICVNGQLLMVDLVEHLEVVPSFGLIQSNTDGLIIKIKKSDFDLFDGICAEWEERCDMVLEFDYIKEIWQKDVNNYVWKGFGREVERKGGWVKELTPLDYDLAIVNEALVNYMLLGTPVKDTINNCNELIKFQKISKLTRKFDYVEWVRNELKNGFGKSYVYYNKCYRIFASTDPTDGKVYKVKGDRMHKFADTSELSFIENGDISMSTVPGRLDRNWYIDLAERRLEQYGVF